jgi:hypothetical protein
MLFELLMFAMGRLGAEKEMEKAEDRSQKAEA